jgi:hypothetical protein
VQVASAVVARADFAGTPRVTADDAAEAALANGARRPVAVHAAAAAALGHLAGRAIDARHAATTVAFIDGALCAVASASGIATTGGAAGGAVRAQRAFGLAAALLTVHVAGGSVTRERAAPDASQPARGALANARTAAARAVEVAGAFAFATEVAGTQDATVASEVAQLRAAARAG